LYPPIRNSYLAVEREQPELYFPQIVRIIVSTGFFLYFSSKKKASAQKKTKCKEEKMNPGGYTRLDESERRLFRDPVKDLFDFPLVGNYMYIESVIVVSGASKYGGNQRQHHDGRYGRGNVDSAVQVASASRVRESTPSGELRVRLVPVLHRDESRLEVSRI